MRRMPARPKRSMFGRGGRVGCPRISRWEGERPSSSRRGGNERRTHRRRVLKLQRTSQARSSRRSRSAGEETDDTPQRSSSRPSCNSPPTTPMTEQPLVDMRDARYPPNATPDIHPTRRPISTQRDARYPPNATPHIHPTRRDLQLATCRSLRYPITSSSAPNIDPATSRLYLTIYSRPPTPPPSS